tara:strand:- start:988 stop:1164 length:177 start_codon:yes stop_codon:yes gene_type:complete
MYQNAGIRQRTVKRGLTLEQAQAWCRNPETSWRTATTPEATERTRRCGMWFDGYSKEG